MSRKLFEESAESAATAPVKQFAVKKGQLLVVGLLLILTTSIIVIAIRHQHQQQIQAQAKVQAKLRRQYALDLKATLSEFQRLQQTIATNVSYFSYNQRLDEAVAATQQLVRSYPIDHLAPARAEIGMAIDDYLMAHKCWQKKLENRYNFIDANGIDNSSRLLSADDPLYQQLFARFPDLSVKQPSKTALDIDLAMRTAWQSADRHLSLARAQIPDSTVESDAKNLFR